MSPRLSEARLSEAVFHAPLMPGASIVPRVRQRSRSAAPPANPEAGGRVELGRALRRAPAGHGLASEVDALVSDPDANRARCDEAAPRAVHRRGRRGSLRRAERVPRHCLDQRVHPFQLTPEHAAALAAPEEGRLIEEHERRVPAPPPLDGRTAHQHAERVGEYRAAAGRPMAMSVLSTSDADRCVSVLDRGGAGSVRPSPRCRA
jgi:hypothetical protein